MLDRLFFKKTPLIGVDIQADAIRLVQVQKNKKHCIADKNAVMALPRDAVIQGEIKKSDDVAFLLKEMVQQLDVIGCAAVVAIPYQHVITKVLQFPYEMHEEMLHAEMNLHIEKYFPEMAEQLTFDFYVIDVTMQLTEVVLVATKQIIVESYVDVVQRAGLKVTAVDIDVCALIRVFDRYWGSIDKNYLLIEVGKSYANMLRLKNKKIAYHEYCQFTSYDALVNSIKKMLSINSELSLENKTIYLISNQSDIVVLEELIFNAIGYLVVSVDVSRYMACSSNNLSLVALGLALREM